MNNEEMTVKELALNIVSAYDYAQKYSIKVMLPMERLRAWLPMDISKRALDGLLSTTYADTIAQYKVTHTITYYNREDVLKFITGEVIAKAEYNPVTGYYIYQGVRFKIKSKG